MKLLLSHDDVFVLGFTSMEKRALVDTLNGSPAVPPSHFQLSKSPDVASKENQRLLEEALADQRVQNVKEIGALLATPGRLKWVGRRWQFTVTRPEIELLLQVINDVRVGCWIALGSPDLELEQSLVIDEKTLPTILQMELAGYLEEFFIGVVSGEISPG